MIRRWMQALHQELTEHDPDEFQVESLAQVRTDLVHRSILFHKEYASSHPLHIPKRMEGEKLTPELVSRHRIVAVRGSKRTPRAALPTFSSTTLQTHPTTLRESE
jgi:hypothetical protein